MNDLARILVTLLIAIATLAAGTTCACTRQATTAKATRACCSHGERHRVPPGECGHCRASALAVVDRDVVTGDLTASALPVEPAWALSIGVLAATGSASSAPAPPPPPDVLARRRVLQI